MFLRYVNFRTCSLLSSAVFGIHMGRPLFFVSVEAQSAELTSSSEKLDQHGT